METFPFKPFEPSQHYEPSEMLSRSIEFYSKMNQRRTIRQFSDEAVPRSVINNCLRAAGTAPSGANKQPWLFAVISLEKMKKKIRIAAEKEEKEFYANRAPESWLEDLRVL